MAFADDGRMAENPVPETLETIAAKIDALRKSNDDRFDKIDERFAKIDERLEKGDERFAKIDEQFVETRAQLGVKIEAVDTKVGQVYDVLIAMRDEMTRNAAAHETFMKRLHNHDIRILALEQPGRPRR